MYIQCIDKSLNGIFTYLYYKLDKNTYKKEISYWSTAIYSGRGGPDKLIDPTNTGNTIKDNFHTINQPNAFVAFHFNSSKALVTGYTLMSRNEEAAEHKYHYPLTWKLEGSNDNKTWTTLHYQSSTRALIGVGVKLTMRTTTQRRFNSFKLTSMGPTEFPSYHLILHRIEFFGIITLANEHTYQNHSMYLHILFCYLFMILICCDKI